MAGFLKSKVGLAGVNRDRVSEELQHIVDLRAYLTRNSTGAATLAHLPIWSLVPGPWSLAPLVWGRAHRRLREGPCQRAAADSRCGAVWQSGGRGLFRSG